MGNFELSPETLKLFKELDSIAPQSLQVCLKTCTDNFKECINAGKDRQECGEKLSACKQKCRQNNSLQGEHDEQISALIDKIIESVK